MSERSLVVDPNLFYVVDQGHSLDDGRVLYNLHQDLETVGEAMQLMPESARELARRSADYNTYESVMQGYRAPKNGTITLRTPLIHHIGQDLGDKAADLYDQVVAGNERVTLLDSAQDTRYPIEARWALKAIGEEYKDHDAKNQETRTEAMKIMSKALEMYSVGLRETQRLESKQRKHSLRKTVKLLSGRLNLI